MGERCDEKEGCEGMGEMRGVMRRQRGVRGWGRGGGDW